MSDDDLPFEEFYAEMPVKSIVPDHAVGARWSTPPRDDPFVCEWHLQVWDPVEASKKYRAAQGEFPDVQASPFSPFQDRQARFLHQMASDSEKGARRLSVPSAAEVVALIQLEREMPNCTKFIRLVRDAVMAAHVTTTPLALPPLLLFGSPGTGKTRACRLVGNILGVKVERISAPSMSGGGWLAGTDATWKTSRPGLIARALVEGASASPLIVLDEIDKCGSQVVGENPLDPLHDALEPEGARAFVDDCTGVPMDASSIFWVATANDPSAIRPSLMDRFQAIEIDPPSPEEMTVVVAALYAELCQAWGEWLEPVLDAGTNQMVSQVHPRLARRVLAAAIMKAISRKRHAVGADDIRAAMADLPVATRKVGFV